ncbi:FtsX-like permease family protein [Streptomyces sp. NPDC006334]|uniref:FtsX-like permease family protein n=1 Tax=Streptomyces sp. NPDC006334 TaxID=3156754 RepID=UPI0033B5ECA6
MRRRLWVSDLGMGARFAFAGGREGWARMLLTAVGVGLGVALLLLTTAIPNALAVRQEREEARTDVTFNNPKIPRSDATLLVADVPTTFREKEVRGREVQPEGPRAPVPPGLSRLPGVGEMVVSPALKRLLESDDGKLLRERLPDRIVGTIGESGLIGSQEFAYFRGVDHLVITDETYRIARIDRFGDPDPTPQSMDPILVLLTLVVFLVLLMPVAVFIAAAVRFGGERRDRRLAALRLVGSDSGMTRRMAAGEAMAGAVVGLVFGTVFFLIGRQAAGSMELLDVSVFPSYLDPSPALALLVAVAVPAAAVLVTLFALRGVVIEPLGVVRTAKPPRRRLWWRLLVPLAGIGLLYPMIGKGRGNGDFNQYLVSGGVLLLLVGVTALLPWIVEAVVARLGAGGLAWQLAIRRLQLSSGTAARMVNGIAVAVAGAIALQMLFAGVEGQYTEETGNDLSRAQMQVWLPKGTALAGTAAAFDATEGVRKVHVFGEAYVNDRRRDAEELTQITVADCATLRSVASIPSCRDGDSFLVEGGDYGSATPAVSKPGTRLWFDDGQESPYGWTVPAGIERVRPVADPTGQMRGGFLLTPAALPAGSERAVSVQVYLSLDDEVADAAEYVRNTAGRIDPIGEASMWTAEERSETFDKIRTGLLVGAACVLALIGASLLVSQLEQLRERRKLLSSLVAFGTRRRTLSLSVLWQTAIPIGLGLLLASLVGITLGTVLLMMTDTPVSVDWASVLSMTGIGAAVVLAVTLLSLPPLVRLMRPEGLRTE